MSICASGRGFTVYQITSLEMGTWGNYSQPIQTCNSNKVIIIPPQKKIKKNKKGNEIHKYIKGERNKDLPISPLHSGNHNYKINEYILDIKKLSQAREQYQ